MNTNNREPDFQKLFERAPWCVLILCPNAPTFTIAAVSDAYLAATMTTRERIMGRPLFNIFPDNPNDPNADGVKNLTASLMSVIEHKSTNAMHIQKYDIRRSGPDGQEFEERFWKPENSPILDDNGELLYICHHVTDVTESEQIIRKFSASEDTADESVELLTQAKRLGNLLVGREVRMLELKKEIERLKGRIGEPAK